MRAAAAIHYSGAGISRVTRKRAHAMNDHPEQPPGHPADRARRIYKTTVAVLIVIMAIELLVALSEGQWLTAFLVATIMTIVAAPFVFTLRLPINIPAEFSLLAVIFIFAALFLGEVRDYYERIWWWDIALHTTSGLLLGILGFLLVYVLNENRRVDLHMRPRFVALFAFLFAVAMGAFWEIFEFGMDQLFGTTMQKPMLGDPSGLTDTMIDLIVDTLGALIISLFGWWHMKRKEESFIEVWIQKFIRRNPRLFRS